MGNKIIVANWKMNGSNELADKISNLINDSLDIKSKEIIICPPYIHIELLIKNNTGRNFYVGSNGKLIETKNNSENLHYIFGDLDISKLLELKKFIDNSNLNYNEVKNLFFFSSGRWDIEIKSGILE